jgi:hypothetical protein
MTRSRLDFEAGDFVGRTRYPPLMRASLPLAGLLTCLVSLACGETPEPMAGTETDTGESETGEPPPPTNPFEEPVRLGLANYVGTIDPSDTMMDGETTHYMFSPADGPLCLRGDPYWMSVREGESPSGDLVIYLQGGGACWSALCQAVESLGAPAVPESGLLNRDLPGNPFAGWNVGYLPYCDGSLFAGDIDIDDDGDQVADRYHRGLINLSAGLDVIKERFPAPQRIVLVGASAGSYGVHIANMLVRTMWLEPEIIVVADAGVGIGKPGDFEFIPGLLGEWNVLHLIPDECSECITDHITNLPRWQLKVDENMRYAAIASYDDSVIGGVFLGLADGEYQAALEVELAKLAERYPERYHRFLFDSSLHTVTGSDSVSGGGLPGLTANFDTTVVAGTSVQEWMQLLVDGDPAFGDLIE